MTKPRRVGSLTVFDKILFVPKAKAKRGRSADSVDFPTTLHFFEDTRAYCPELTNVAAAVDALAQYTFAIEHVNVRADSKATLARLKESVLTLRAAQTSVLNIRLALCGLSLEEPMYSLGARRGDWEVSARQPLTARLLLDGLPPTSGFVEVSVTGDLFDMSPVVDASFENEGAGKPPSKHVKSQTSGRSLCGAQIVQAYASEESDCETCKAAATVEQGNGAQQPVY